MSSDPQSTPRILKVIDTVVGSEERRRIVLRAALDSAGQAAIPEDLDELRLFVRAHLMPALSSQIGGRLATVVLADIDLAIQKEQRRRARRNGPPSSDQRAHEAVSDSSDPPARSSPRPVVPESAREASSVSVRQRKPKCAVLVVDRDRVGASMLARSIIHSGCEVAVADATALDSALTGEFEPDVLVLTERDALDMSPSLRALLTRRPHLAVVIRVTEHQRLAESMVHAIGARKCVAIARSSPTLEVVHLARRLCTESLTAVA